MPTGFVKSTIHAPGGAAAGGRLGEVEHDRHGPQRLGEAAGAGRLLADGAEAQRQRLVDEPGGLAADAQLDEHEVGAVERRVAVVGRGSAGPASAPSTIRWARPPTIARRSGSMSSRTSSSTGSRSDGPSKPSTSSGV